MTQIKRRLLSRCDVGLYVQGSQQDALLRAPDHPLSHEAKQDCSVSREISGFVKLMAANCETG
jgi:hypothetical protein